MAKKHRFATVAISGGMRMANCIARHLNVNGVPSAVEHPSPKKWLVRVKSTNAKRARKLLKRSPRTCRIAE